MTTITIYDTLQYVTTMLRNQRLTLNGDRPARQMAQNVLGTMLQPPFCYRFNRATTSFAISTAQGTDYTELLPDLGWIEEQWLVDGSGKVHELKGALSLAKVGTVRRPVEMSPQYEDDNGNLTFRFNGVPDQNYNAFIDYQKRCPVVTDLGQTFYPVTDDFAYLFNRGMLSEGALATGDARFTVWRREWIAGILALQDGLDDQAKAMLMEQLMNSNRTNARAQGASQQGVAGRGI